MREVSALFLTISTLVTPSFAFDTFNSNEGGYAVNFPAPPEENVRNFENGRIVTHAERNADVVYVAAHGDFRQAVNADVEMKLNIENYASQVHATVTAKEPVSISRGGKILSGIRFSYDGEVQRGKGIVVVDGTSSYLVAASAIKPNGRIDKVDAFVDSFRLTPK